MTSADSHTLLAPAAAMRKPADDRAIDVCVCTFRRPSITQTLASLAAQKLPDGWSMRVIVADNDETPTARDMVQAGFAQFHLDGVYLHAPARNISIARNACLDAASAPLAAFLDDDETAQPDWLAALIAKLEASNADIVFGRVQAVYQPGSPKWLQLCDFHSSRDTKGSAVFCGYTCNVALRIAALNGRRFDIDLGKSGGEDTIFFAQMYLAGASAAYEDDAVVEEPVSAVRGSLGWLLPRYFRKGQTLAMVYMLRGKARANVAMTSFLKIAFCAGTAAVTIFSPTAWRKAVMRGAMHAGALSMTLGKSPIKQYG